MRDLLKFKASELGLELTDIMLDQFELFYNLLIEKNKVMNLTAVTEPEMVVDRHFIDSLSIVKSLDMSEVDSLIDVGTGAGFPGIPLKIVYPHLKLTLLDSLNKRIIFLDDVISKLGLDNVITVHGRAEDIAHNELYRQKYDLVVSRAVADLAVLSEYCIPFAGIGGKFVSYKSGNSELEISKAAKAIKVLGGNKNGSTSFLLPGTDLSRSIVVIDKINNTPSKYPRKAGTPSKTPIR